MRKKSKRLCSGCRANFYNYPNKLGVEECWHYANARVVDKLVYYSPGDYSPSLRKNTLSCWHNRMGHGEIKG
jgi:hypothetical protein